MRFLEKEVRKNLAAIFLISLIFVFGAVAGVFYFSYPRAQNVSSYEKFLTEVYQKVKENYWKKLSEKELAGGFQNALEGSTLSLNLKRVKNFKEFLSLYKKKTASLDKKSKEEITLKLANSFLASLEPRGKNKLLSKDQKQKLIATVKNQDKSKTLLKELGVSEKASVEEIRKKAEEKINELEKKAKTNPKFKEKLKKAKLAEKTLTDEQKRKAYLKQGLVPTIIFEPLSSNVHYLKISRFSPQTWQEFYNTFSKENKTQASFLIIDLRGNIGGAIDILPYFLGPFIGPGNIAYEFFHQGEKIPFRTKTGWLPGLLPYKKVVILIDKKVQSSAEVAAATLKKYNVGVLVGERTMGWGTVETILPLKTKLGGKQYTLFLVTNLTLRDDNQPIEGRGVEPDINIHSKNWKKELYDYFSLNELINFVDKLWKGEIGY